MFKSEIFAKLATLTGQEVDLEKLTALQKKSWQQTEGDHLATLVRSAQDMHVTINPVRLKYSEALWKASEDCPIIIWNESEKDWVLITKSGLLSVSIAEGESPFDRTKLFHNSLMKKLSIRSRREEVEVGIVQYSLPFNSSSSLSEDQERLNALKKEKGEPSAMRPELRYWKMLLEDKKDILTLFIFSIFSGVLYLTVPLAVDTVVSNLAFGTQSKPYIQALFVIGQVVMACLVLQAVITGFQYYISDVIQRRIFARATADIAYRLPRTRIEDFDKVHLPEVVNRFLDVVTAQKNTAFFLLDGINTLMATVIGMILLSLYHPFLLVFVIILIILIVVIVQGLGRGAVETSIIESKAKYSMVSWFEEIAAYPTLFKGPGGYELATSRANKLATDYVNARSSHFHVVIRQVTGLLVLSVIASVVLLIGGAWLVISQQITLGQLVASEIIMGSIIASLAKFGKKLEAWYDTMAAMDKLGQLFDLRIESPKGEEMPINQEGGFEVRAESVCFNFPGQAPLFKDLTFDFKAGSRVAVIGPYGSGISALMNMFFGMREPTSGFIALNGVDIKAWKRSSLRQQVLLLRPNRILHTTIIDNLRLGFDDIGLDEVNVALGKVGLLDEFLSHPEGLHRRLSTGGAKLATNKRVALLIARALVQKPKLLIIDELFDGLAEHEFERLSEVILAPEHKWTVLFATRKTKYTTLCDEIIDLGNLDS